LQIARHDLSVADTERGYRLLNVDHTTIHLGRTRVGWTGRWRCRLRYARSFLPLHDRARIRAAHWLRYFKSLGVDLISPGEVISELPCEFISEVRRFDLGLAPEALICVLRVIRRA
jgi:hypothetical protein